MSNAEAASLVTAAGDDAVALAVIPPRPWAGIERLLATVDVPPEVSRQMPSIKDPWSILRLLLRLSEADRTLLEPTPNGWDPKRPTVIALVNSAANSVLDQIGAITFHDANVPMHVRVIVPAVNSRVLGAALQKVLVQLPHDVSNVEGRYLIAWNPPNAHVAVAVIPEQEHVRLELLYILHKPLEEKHKADLFAQLEHTAVAPPPRRNPGATGHLAANSRGFVVGFRPMALAQELELAAPMKMMAALDGVDPHTKIRILAQGVAEILEGHLLVSFGKSEIAEAALAVDFEQGVHAQGLAQLTPTGQRQLSVVINSDGTPLQIPANTLASMALAFKPGSNIKKAEPVLGTYLNASPPDRYLQVFRDAGSMAFPVLFAKPIGVWRKLIGDAPLSKVIGDVTEPPQDIALDLLDVDERRGPVYRWRAYVSNNTAPAWWNVTRMLAEANGDLERVQQQRGTSGTWMSWTHGPAPAGAQAPANHRNDVPKGTFAVGYVDTARLANRLEADPDVKRRLGWLLPLLRHLGPISSLVRLQGSWVVSEMHTGSSPSSKALVIDPPAPNAALDDANPTPGRVALEQATAEVSKLMAVERIVDTELATLLAEGHAKLKPILDQAKNDPSTRSDADALERMLAELENYPVPPVVRQAVSDPTHFQCGQGSCLVGKETCCGGPEEGTGKCIATVSPGKDDKTQRLASQIDACEKAGLTPATLARCDESIDCGNNEACCEQYLFGGASSNLCVRITRSDRSPCEMNEVCIEGSPCRAPGSVCINGTCQKVVTSLRCGTNTCTPPNNVCCLDAMRCAAPSECKVGVLHCARHSDCLKGQFCQVSNSGTQCTGGITWGVASSACDKDADCGPNVLCGNQRTRCLPSDYLGIRYCGCE